MVMEKTLAEKIERAVENLRNGKFVLVYDADGREEEVDFVLPGILATPSHIREMRKHGGGLICVTVPSEVAELVGLPYMVDVIKEAGRKYPTLRALHENHVLPYDTHSAFSITVNHVTNYTGITDMDRAKTISALGEYVKKILGGGVKKEKAAELFIKNFRSPGHVHLLRAAPGLLKNREGHTELATALCQMAGLSPSAVICEMMGNNHRALPKKDAERYGKEKGYILLEGWEIKEAWKEWCG